MAQFIRPTSDVSTGGWVSTPLWSKIDDDTSSAAADADLVSVGTNPSNDTFECHLADPSTPGAGSHIIKCRARRVSGAKASTIDIQLYEGASSIASLGATSIGDTWVEYTYTLSAGEVSSITDYTDLRIRIVANTSGGGSPTTVGCSAVEMELPDAAGGTAYVRVQDETEQISEATNTLKAMPRSQDETEQISEGAEAHLESIRVTDETENVSEGAEAHLAAVRLADETEQITEGTLAAGSFVRSQDTDEEIGEAVSSLKASTRVQNETEEISEATVTAKFALSVTDESVSVSETTLVIADFNRLADETVEVGETVLGAGTFVRGDSTDVSLTETTITAVDFVRVVDESVSVSEAVSTIAARKSITTETERILESVLLAFVIEKGGGGPDKDAEPVPVGSRSYEAYPHGNYRFEETYDDDLSGMPLRRGQAERDYLDRLVRKPRRDRMDRDEMLKWWVHRYERPDVDP